MQFDPIPYQKYIQTGIDMLRSGDEHPTSRAMISRLGGSMTTANKGMKALWAYVGEQLDYQEKYPAIPGPVIDCMERFVEICREEAGKELDDVREACARERDDALQQYTDLTNTWEQLKQDNAILTGEKEALEVTRSYQNDQIGALNRQNAQLSEEHQTLQTSHQSLQQDLQSAELATFLTVARALEIFQQKDDEFAGQNRHLTTLESALTSEKEAYRVLETRMAQNEKTTESLGQLLDKTQASLAETRVTLDSRSAELQERQDRLQALSAEVSQQREQKDRLARDNEELTSRCNRQKTEISNLRKVETDLLTEKNQREFLQQTLDEKESRLHELNDLIKELKSDKLQLASLLKQPARNEGTQDSNPG